MQILGRRSAISTALGAQTSGQSRRASDVEEVAVAIQRGDLLGGEFAGAATAAHSAAGTLVQLSADERAAAGYAAISLVDRVGAAGGLQYGLTGQTSIAIGHRTLRISMRDQNDSIVAVGV